MLLMTLFQQTLHLLPVVPEDKPLPDLCSQNYPSSVCEKKRFFEYEEARSRWNIDPGDRRVRHTVKLLHEGTQAIPVGCDKYLFFLAQGRRDDPVPERKNPVQGIFK